MHRNRQCCRHPGIVPTHCHEPARSGSSQPFPTRAFLCELAIPERARKPARKKGIWVRLDRTRVKGSHGSLNYDGRRTVMTDRMRPLETGTLRGMCKRFGIDPNDL